MGGRQTLAEVGQAAAACTSCRLAAGRMNVVFGEGPADADVMLIGEAPGRLEDESGRPFCGRSGDLLGELLANAGIDRAELYITSIVKCRPPSNRDPRPDEIEPCWDWLDRQLRLIRPRLICTLGNFAMRRLLGRGPGISSVHGSRRRIDLGWGAVDVIPLFHPAAALRSTGTRQLLAEDLRLITQALRSLG